MCDSKPIPFIDLVEIPMVSGQLEYLFPSNDIVFDKNIKGVTLRGQTEGDNAYSFKGKKLVTDEALASAYLVIAKNSVDVLRIPLSMLVSCCDQPYFPLDLSCLDAGKTRIEFKNAAAFTALVSEGEALELIFITDGPL